ncbi:MAG: hypothetical protein A2700_00580 [Candidatus Blackburnbacteria bacterium RIFCSPHIGHO2_01_FULL_44_64]|uniref:DUF1868 domain-containing protein n=1 Tax=Candidatus Blackburnbacteria bacterium RIFCSPHIGHO2_02_FULL_44_20 TaxID=1797516 RepID=A0A1G1V9N6_9BACT|nr:MAG: hypothetical protein A2700_00580 [Candidatus Blackburnbacteria bacterium RIFCSPHIGHO2_01_FULL_44_64]OGY10169.1 MAG: hypothetical protein A3E16_02895 [Candidatus Blackburnbacteria bacterium RIFCSPHIGHO2_12_FULL_44_25]OGY12017.1 MAG: hypothetical protein A3D26_00645 [Candidatus Blackburnbacteria bacterium RIFCSPHIGHO2_02_FULL_44_20]OGY14541.1 MAG: hypothetical protein A3A62_03420 [Candidatus Blackburnbacteria bacterium RIFCSPLOWO2_01_FULL_44_43]OGY17458.1 MAG: hypothetical protein A3H88_0
MAELITPVERKYAGIQLSGLKALREGTIPEFSGFPDSLNNRYNASFVFTPNSTAQFEERVAQPLAAIADQAGIGLYLASRDFCVHSTLLEGAWEGEDQAVKQALFGQIHSAEAIGKLDLLVGKKIEFQYLLIGGNTVLTAVNIPEWVLAARAQLNDVYRTHGLKPLSMDNILHITVARMTRLPEGDKEEKIKAFQAYRKMARDLRHSISASPLILEVGAVSTVPPLELLRIAA